MKKFEFSYLLYRLKRTSYGFKLIVYVSAILYSFWQDLNQLFLFIIWKSLKFSYLLYRLKRTSYGF